ncbi:hypothetical protein E2R66_25245 [Mucilaginibacter psychrotolerans]|uniref:DUF3592 domain-containing protein n=2 Tax=Mucilaginibacter psychrotolerans TaxID=1524096 RepID=A0A4Y8S585_9SPHI|nr:hypothetical protein E2R66_25245 [Mucilaginibacter psychrotolerans]
MKANKFEVKNLLVPFVILVVVVFLLFNLVKKGKQTKNRELAIVNRKFKYSRGVITKMFYYKSQRIRIEYKLNGIKYQYEGSWDDDPRSLREGDSINFRYSVTNPNLIIHELENVY